jgi:Flp pilus assembly pilin Flp
MPVLTRTNLDCPPPVDTEAVLSKRTRRGATLIEYLMMISLILVVCLVAIGYLGTANSGNLSSSSNAINKSLKKGS